MSSVKTITFAIAAGLLVASANAFGQLPSGQAQDTAGEQQRPTIGLVLSGGGARGAAHVGVLKVLKELQVPIDVIAGTSMGAIIGGLYAAGLEPEELEAVVLDIDWQDAFYDRPARKSLSFRRKQDDRGFLVKFDLGFNGGNLQLPKGLIQGQKLGLILRELTLPVSSVTDFDKLSTPFRAVAADLGTGAAVVLGNGDLVKAMRASMSAPGVFSPVELDGRTLVDGGLAKNIPIDVGRAMGADIIIAVDVGFPLLDVEQLDSAVAVTNQMLTILIYREAARQIASMKPTDILLEPALGDFSSTDFQAVAETIEPGEAAARSAGERLRGLGVDSEAYDGYLQARASVRQTPPTPRFVTVTGDVPLSPRVIGSRLEYEVDQPLNPAEIARDAERVYGLELFEEVDYSLIEVNGETGLQYQIKAKSWGPNYLRFGLSFEEDFERSNSFNVGARYIRTAVNRLGAEWRTDLQIGSDPGLRSEFYQPLSFDLRYFVAPEFRAGQRSLDFFQGTQAAARYRVTEGEILLSAGRELGSTGEVRVGIRRGTGNARLQIGDEALPNIDFDEGAYFLQLRRDSLDDPQFPRSGTELNLSWSLERPGIGSDTNADLITATWLKVRSFDRNSIAVGVDLATTEANGESIQNFFSLGGFLNLSGLDRGELTGPHAGLARLIFYRQMGQTGGGLFDWPLYAGMSLEAGNVWNDRDDIRFDSLLFNGSLFVGLDTFFGPLFFATGFSEDGDTSFYLFLGSPLR